MQTSVHMQIDTLAPISSGHVLHTILLQGFEGNFNLILFNILLFPKYIPYLIVTKSYILI